MPKKIKLVLWLSVLITGLFLSSQAQARIPKEPFKIWHDREFLGRVEMQKNVYMDAGLFLQGALVNYAPGGAPVLVNDHLKVEGILFANNIIVRGNSGGDPVIIGDNLRIDGYIFNPFDSVRIKDNLTVRDFALFLGEVKIEQALSVVAGNLTIGIPTSPKFKVKHETGETIILGPLTVAGDTSFKNLTVSGRALVGSLRTTGDAFIGGKLTVVGPIDPTDITYTGTLSGPNAKLSGTLEVAGASTFKGNITLGDAGDDLIIVRGSTTFSRPINVNGGISVFSGNLTVQGVTTLASLTVPGIANIYNLKVATNIETATLTTTGNLNVGGNLNVTGNAICDTINFTHLTVSGNTLLQGAVQLGDAPADGITIRGTASFTEPISVTSTVGTSTFANHVNISGNLHVAGTLTAGTIGALGVSGTTTSSFVINSDNTTADTEDSQLEFERGVVTPNAILRWDSINDRFDFNQRIYAALGLDVTGANFTVGPFTVVPATGTVTAGSWQATPIGISFGGTGATTAAGARTNLGATTVGSNLFTLPNPNAVRFIRINADNTVATRTAEEFRGDIGAGAGTVTSVGLAMPAQFTVTGSPVTTSGTLTASWVSQAANTVLAGPAAGAPAVPTFRTLVPADIPNLDASKITTGVFDVARIPDLDAAKITTGRFGLARLPTSAIANRFLVVRTANADPIYDALVADDIPSLDAAKITTGVFDNARINWAAPGAIGTITPAAGTFTTLAANTSLTIGGGAAITRHLSATFANVASSSIDADACGIYATLTVPGAVPGDTVVATPTPVADGIEAFNLIWNAYVSAANTVIIRACNPTPGAIDTPDTQTWRVDVWQH